MKKTLLILQPALLIVLRIFLDRRYLKGRHFEGNLVGLAWSVRAVWQRNVLRLGRPQKAPMGLNCSISRLSNLRFHPDDLNNLQSPNLYIQNYRAEVELGRGTYIGPNVGLITANHNPLNLDQHLEAKPIYLGENCWIGMNSVILPGVTLGPNTVVGAGSIVTRSFPDGYRIIAGNPARSIRKLTEGSAPSDRTKS